ncbi:MAG: sugar phosphate nucleotidyltransferase [Pseudonocardiaceae bacterium]
MTRTSLPQVVIIAGGKGTRLGWHTAHLPKILVPVVGRPFLDYVLTLLCAQGAEHVHFCLAHHAEKVVDYLTERRDDDVDYTWSVEHRAMGTAGALRLALPWLAEEFVVLLGDTYTPVDFDDIVTRFRADGRPVAMAVLRNHDWLVPSNVRVADGSVIEYVKGAPPGRLDYVDYGIAVMCSRAVRELPEEVDLDLRQLFDRFIAAGDLAAIEVPHRFYEIGSPSGYAEFDRLVREGRLVAMERAR